MENKNTNEKVKGILNDEKDLTNEFDEKDINSGKVMSILAYLGILSLIPYFTEKNNKYVIFNAKQGMNLLIIEIILSFGLNIFFSVLPLYWFVKISNTLVSLSSITLSIIGIINVCCGKAKELPIINKIKFIK